MPTVPIIQEPSVRSRAMPARGLSVRASPQDFGADIASGLGQASDQVAQIAERERDRQNSVAVMSAERQLNEWETERLYGEDGVLRRKGREALGAPDEFVAEYEDKIAEIQQELGNEDQRQTFQQIAFRRVEDARRTTMRYERDQIEAYAEAETEAYLTSSRQAAAANYTNPDRVDTEIRRQRAAIRSQGVRNGLPAEVVDQRVAEATSATHARVLERMLANNQYRQAEQYLDQNRTELVGEQLTRAEKAVEQGTIRAEGQQAADRILSEAGDRSNALRAAREIDDPQVRDEAVQRVNQRFDEIDAAQREQERERMREASNVVEETGDTAQIPPQVWSDLSVSQRSALETRARQVRQGIEPTTDWGTYYDLTRMASDPDQQQQFAKLDLMEHRSDLSNTEFKSLVSMQEQIRTDGTNPQGEWLRSKNQMVDDSLRSMGYSPTPENEQDAATVRRFRGSVQDEITLFERRNDREPTPQEFRTIIDRLMLEGEVRRDWAPDPNRRFFQVEPGQEFYIDDVPDDERRRIEQALRRQGKRVTEEAVIRLYTLKKVGRPDARAR